MTGFWDIVQARKARLDFFKQGIEDTAILRPEIYASWKRSLAYGLDPDQQKIVKLTLAELQARNAANADLLEIAIPYMNILHDTVKGSEFVITLSDSDGFILKNVGDEAVLDSIQTKDNPLVEGVCCHESVFGTGGVGTPLALRRPIQLASVEHFYESPKEFTGTGAPLIDEAGNLLGVLCMSGERNKVHSHTLGMVTAASHAIVRQLTLRHMYDTLLSTQNQMCAILSTIDRGVFLLDANLTVIDTNTAATKILGHDCKEMVGRPVGEIIKTFDFLNVSHSLYDIETSMKGRQKQVQCLMTIHRVDSPDFAGTSSLLVTFWEVANARRFINRYIGSSATFTFDDIQGKSEPVAEAKSFARIAADNTSTVLLLGESGTGKELFAQSIHNGSKKADGPFVAVNCGAIPKSLIESELFGYEAGAFSGAKRDGSAGKFELANHGTIFLDEIGDMPFEIQIHLLRILQMREVTRIGGHKPIPLDIRVIAATNVDLEKAVHEKTFRSDLYYRLKVMSINIPPLRERGADIQLLAGHFVEKNRNANSTSARGFSADAVAMLRRYSWPGNIRELENAVERACLLCRGEFITPEFLPESIRGAARATVVLPDGGAVPPSVPSPQFAPATIDEAERMVILRCVRECDGNVSKAAKSLNMNRRTLYRKLEKHQIVVER